MAPSTSAALRVLAFAAILVAPAHAVPAPASRLTARQSITAASQSQIDSYTPYTYYASAGYCAASATLAWDCGANCEANPGFEPTASGGDGDDTQFWFVGYDPSLQSVIVSHQGTDPSEIEPILTDGDIKMTTLSSSLFPGLSSSIEVHEGFADAQSSTASDVLSAVQTTLSEHGASHVTAVGHSLGAAISLLDAVYLHVQLPMTTVSFIGYGLPRVGNQDFANYVDGQPISVTHINNEEDFIPILPGMFLGFVHPSGEVHIEDSGEWANCPGQDNPSTQCIVGDVPEIWDGDESDHDGPYNGVEMGC